jgi:hypothetical protein
MEQTLEPRFSCTGCGKTFRWKPEIAGKKAKCGCGATVAIPTEPPGSAKTPPKITIKTTPIVKKAIPVTAVAKKVSPQPTARVAVAAAPPKPVSKLVAAPAPPPPPPPAEEDQDTYDFADDMSKFDSLMPTQEQIAAAENEAPAVLPAEPVPAQALEYRRPSKAAKASRPDRVDPMTGELPDPMRNFIVPAVLLAAGLAGVVLHVTSRLGIGAAATIAIPIILALMLAFTAVKTLVLVLLAFPLATYSDVYMGLLRTAIFKLAATIFFGDIAILWLIAALRSAGVIQGRGEGGIGFWLIYAVVLALIFYVCFLYLFRISVADFRFAYRMSLASRICNLALNLALIALVGLIAVNRAGTRANALTIQPLPPQNPNANVPISQVPITVALGTPVTAQPGQNTPTVTDTLISRQIQLGHMTEGYAWCRAGTTDDAAKKLIDDMYHAGAQKVSVQDLTVYTELPDDPAKRSACLDIAHAFRQKYHMDDSASVDKLNYQYVVISLLAEEMNQHH